MKTHNTPHPYLRALAILCVMILALSSYSIGRAQDLVTTILPPEDGIQGATRAQVRVVTLNMGSEAAPHVPQATLDAVIAGGGHSWPVTLERSEDPEGQAIAPGAFASTLYEFEVPTGLMGTVLLEVRGLPSVARAALNVEPGPDAVENFESTTAATASATDPEVAEDASTSFVRSFAGRMSAHEPIYFIYGPDDPAAKFQFSFKYRVFSFDHSIASVADTLQFGYTQRSLWDWEGDSSPFYDTSYIPELIFEALRPLPEDSGWFTWLGYQFGFRHESNGRDGPISRSLNTAYLRPSFAIGPIDSWHLLVMPEVFVYLGEPEDNPDIDEYRGYGQLRMVFGKNDGPALMATAMAGEDFDHGSIQLDLTVPLKTRFLDFQAYFLVQYFNGYGESLLNYNEKSETVRAGFSFVR